MGPALGVPVVSVAEPEAAARDAPILVTITSSRTPVLEGRWIAPGAHVNAAGSNALQRAELDVEAVRLAAAGVVVTDSIEQARLECGDLVAALQQGAIRWEDVHELGEVVAGRHSGRTRPDQVTLFESQGVAMEDVAVAIRLVARARERRVGTEIPI
jgi:ornithine cyclodeaminase/alanine dehydrogenase-like protein (mu-crystallin family)